MDITIEITEIIAESTINETVIYCDVVISDAGGSMIDVPIETASANGVPIPIVNKNIDIIIPTKTSDLTKDDVYTKIEINNKLSAVYEFKGSVLTYAELPTDAENADVYNVEENGVNYAWVQATESWDSLGGLIGLATLTENGLLSKEDFAKLQNLSGTNTGDETQDSLGEKIEITELESITDTTKIAASDSAFLKWFSGLRIKNYLTGFFAKLSGGNTFSGNQTFSDRTTHNKGAQINGIQDNDSFVILNVNYPGTIGNLSDTRGLKITSGGGDAGLYSGSILFDVGYGGGKAFIYTRRLNGPGARFYISTQDTAGNIINPFVINENGNINTLIGKYHFNAASPTSDTINDIRTVNTSGLWELFKCSLGNATKGLGTWIYGRLKLGMVIETEINEYADNAAALAAGLTAGMKYRTGDLYKIVH